MNVPKAFCITLQSTPWREAFAATELSSAGLDYRFYYGFCGPSLGVKSVMRASPKGAVGIGHLGCSFSHLSLWRALLTHEGDSFLIFEDDVGLNPLFRQKLGDVIPLLPADWDMVYLGWTGGRAVENKGVASYWESSLGTFAYMVTRRALEVMVRENQTIWSNIDCQLLWTSNRKLNVYCLNERLAFHRSDFASLAGGRAPTLQSPYSKVVLEKYTKRSKDTASSYKLPPIHSPIESPYIIKKNISSARFDFIVGNENGRSWYDLPKGRVIQNECWTELDFIKKHILKPGMVVFDVGAHHGFYSLCFSRWVGPAGRVVAFEPFPQNADLITFNAQLNDASNIEIESVAVSDARGSTGASQSEARIGVGNDDLSVPTCALDEFLDRKPDFLKIDCEGAERSVLRGAKRILAKLPHLCIEIHKFIIGDAGVRELETLVDWSRYNCTYVVDGNFVPWSPGAPINQNVTTLYAVRKQ